MNIQIRRGCFETNSSSTHSLQLVGSNENSSDTLLKMIATDIKKWSESDTSKFVINNKLYLKGIKGAGYSDECDVIIMITQWMPKIQYLYATLATSLVYIDEDCKFKQSDIDDALAMHLEMDYDDKFAGENLEKLWQIQMLIDKIKETSEYTYDSIVLADVEETRDYDENSGENHEIFTYEELTNKDLLKAKLDSLMNTTIIAANIAYSPYDGKYIYIY